MLNIVPPAYVFCPFCARQLSEIRYGNDRFKHCSFCKWTYYPHVGASSCGVIIKNSQILLVRRALEPYKNTWMFPAGFVSYGEHPQDTVVREIEEEIGYKSTVKKLLGVEQTADDPRSPGHFAFFYEIELGDKVPATDLEENSEISWFNLSRLPLVGWLSHRKVLKSIGGNFSP